MDPRLPDRIRTKITATHGPIQPLTDGTVVWPCWEWTAAHSGGYGMAYWNGRMHYAHRVVYELLVGPIPARTDIDHLCRKLDCVNPAHLEAVTHSENLRRAWNTEFRTHCMHGHELTPENTYIMPSGAKRCQACNAARQRRFQERRRASL